MNHTVAKKSTVNGKWKYCCNGLPTGACFEDCDGHDTPKEAYDQEFEGRGAQSVPVTSALRSSGWGSVDADLLMDLQEIHDTVLLDRWPAGLRTLAANYHLDIPECLEVE